MDDKAVSAPVAMSVALALFMGVFASLAISTGNVAGEGSGDAAQAATHRVEASSLLDLLLQSPGYSDKGAGGIDWLTHVDDRQENGQDAEDHLVRLGLREVDSPHLSFDKFENLRRAPYALDTTDGYVNYEEARAALGFDDVNLGFHVRATPSLRSVRDILDSGERDPNLRVTYVGATTGADEDPNVFVNDLACSADGDQLRVSLDVTNGGDLNTQLSAFVTLTQTTGSGANLKENTRSEWLNGPNMVLTSTHTLSSSFPSYETTDAPALCAEGATLEATIYDKSGALLTVSTTLPADAAVDAVPAHGHGLLLDTNTPYTLTGSDAVFSYGGAALDDAESLTFTLDDGAGNTVSSTFAAGAFDDRTVTVGDAPTVGDHLVDWGGSLAAGTYTATLADGDGSVVTEKLYVFSSAPSDYGHDGFGSGDTLTDDGRTEVGYLEQVIEQFCPFFHDDGGAALTDGPSWADRCAPWGPFEQGDVILDTKKNMDDDLPLRLLDADGDPTYDHVSTLVVGSNVDHQSMTSAAAKHAVRDWVLGGGTLIVFGSNEQAVQWLQPIFHSGIESSSTGIATPDHSHPLLHVPDDLDYNAYDKSGVVWGLKNTGGDNSADKFTNVVPAAGEDQHYLTISDPGAYDDGTVILTSWLPYDMYGDGRESDQGILFINNMLTQSYRGLFLDYGPAIPEGQSVVPAIGRAQIFHPRMERLVSLDMTLFVFDQG